MNPIRKQRGMGALGILYVLVSLAVLGLIGLKLFPLYLEAYKIEAALVTVANAPGASEQTPKQLAYSIVKRLDVDAVTRIQERTWKDYLTIKIKGKEVSISSSYDAEVPLFMNISLRAVFKHSASNAN